jgi:signal transduction histidine kinase
VDADALPDRDAVRVGETSGRPLSPIPPARSIAARICARLDAESLYIVDSMIAGLTLGVAFALLEATVPAGVGHQPWWAFALAAGTAIPLVWRRRAPFAVAMAVAVSAATFAAAHIIPPPPTPIGVLIVAYTLADLGTLWERRVGIGVGLAAVPLAFQGPVEALPQPVITIFGAYVLGTVVRSRRGYAAVLESRAHDLERERDAQAERATLTERARIAREMHDILGHAVSIMVVQAEAGPVVVYGDPDRAVAVFDAVADAGREAMEQVQRLLGLLDDGHGAERRSPQPRLSDLDDLIAGVRASGLAVTVTTSGAPREVPADLEAAVFRTVQEALTNTVKHAGAATAAVRIEWTDRELLVQVSDDGRGGAAHDREPVEHNGRVGRGLVGIRERAAAFGGSMAAGPNAAGDGFVVTVRIPAALSSPVTGRM